jgi:1-deoxy-D-xylulose-5-phosphate synthase
MEYPLLSGIRGPADIKEFSSKDLNRLAAEIRDFIVYTVARNGGHLASNLGVVELSIALHRVFESPADMIVWDVGHQCYAHKLLTGRFPVFSGLRQVNGIAGFPKRSESPHDQFNTGHASTSISAALGMLAADRIQGGKARAVAVIGDGALTGGLAYEALSHAGQLGLPLIVILNDNKMAISANVGGMSKYLSQLSMKARYQAFRTRFDAMAKRIPFVGTAVFNGVSRLKRAVKAVFYTDNFFVDLGFEYAGPIDGHNIQGLITVLEDVRRLERPVVIHVITRKGKGYSYAEDDPGAYHGVGSFSISGGIDSSRVDPGHAGQVQADDESLLAAEKNPGRIGFTDAFSAALLAQADRDSRVLAITAAMEQGCGLASFRKAFGHRFFDVGIAEEHALTFASGLVVRGLKPVVAVYSTFMQRAVDQFIHDAALQKLPIVIALDRAGFVGDDGETHQGLFDIALFRPAPHTAILAPASESELRLMLDWALADRVPYSLDTSNDLVSLARRNTFACGPVIIRYPKSVCPAEIPAFSFPLEPGRGIFISGPHADSRVCLAFTGSLYTQAVDAASLLAAQGIKADLYNLRFLKPIDEDYLAEIINRYELVVFIEEGIKSGGFGEYAQGLAVRRGGKAVVAALAVGENFAQQGTREQLLRMNGLDAESIAQAALRHYRNILQTQILLN